MPTLGIDCADQFRQGNASPAGDFLQSLPECIFETNTRFVASGHDRALDDERFHDATSAVGVRLFSQSMKLREKKDSATLAALRLRHDRNGFARNHREQQKESQLCDIERIRNIQAKLRRKAEVR